MSWPTPQDYNEAIQNPALCFADERLIAGVVTLNPLGLPKATTGAFASVYKISSKGKDWAVRCFLSDRAEQKDRYQKISEFVLLDDLDCTVPFHFIEKGILVKGQWHPIIIMDWVAGITLDAYVRRHYRNSETIRSLVAEFHKLANELERAGIAHGDLQHGNILVTGNGEMRLVDYDGLFVPALAGKTSLEIGHPNYQHPRRNEKHYDTTVDNFSCWLIATALKAVSLDPELFHHFNFGDECILFKRTDLANPSESDLFFTLLNHSSPEIRDGASILLRMLWSKPESIPELSASSEELERLPSVEPGLDEASLNDLLEADWQERTEYDTALNAALADKPTYASAKKQAKRSAIQKVASVVGKGAGAFFREADPTTWINFKFNQADNALRKKQYDHALQTYLEIYRHLDGKVHKSDDNYRKALLLIAYCYTFLGSANQAHNYFLVGYNAANSPSVTRFTRSKMALLLAMSHYAIDQKEAAMAVFDSNEVAVHLDAIVIGELSGLSFIKNSKSLEFLVELLEYKVDDVHFNAWADSGDVVTIFRSAMKLYKAFPKNSPAQIDRLACRMLFSCAESLISSGKTVRQLASSKQKDEFDGADSLIEGLKRICEIILEKEGLNSEPDGLSLERCLEIAQIQSRSSKKFQLMLKWLQFEERVRKLSNHMDILEEIEMQDYDVVSKFVLTSLPKQTTLNVLSLAMSAVPALHPKSYDLLLMVVARHGTVKEYNALVKHCRAKKIQSMAK